MMRLALLFVVLAACSKDLLQEDTKMFCRAIDVLHQNNGLPINGPNAISLRELGPFFEEHAKSPEMKQLVGKLKSGEATVDQFLDGVRALLEQKPVEPCPTMKWAEVKTQPPT